jgi:FlaA1/EpsC-like NDP-sugar epimerase
VLSLLLAYRRALIVGAHLALVATAYYFAFLLRLDGGLEGRYQQQFWQTLPLLVSVRAVLFYRFRLFEGLWRYTSLWDLRTIVVATAVGSAILAGLVEWIVRLESYPRSVFILDMLLEIFLLGGVRLVGRMYRELGARTISRRILIFGAGDVGAMIAREMQRERQLGIQPVGFIDDDESKRGRSLHGVRVLGSRRDVPRILEATRPDELLVAIPHLSPRDRREVLNLLEGHRLTIKTVPGLKDLVDDGISLGAIRPLSIDDLLERPQVSLNDREVERSLESRHVLVTGAGGSIGSELCRQIARFAPARLIMLDRYENGLYAVEQDLGTRKLPFQSVAVIADITDRARIEEVFHHYRPDIVFHAAAHKHVPLMEANPLEAVKNNVLGTYMLTQIAVESRVSKFVLISTDKAVNPSSVMGTCKRIAEMIVCTATGEASTVFAAVRFGNVLGSNGSVVPLFLEQIRRGGPVTVTHPEVRRYFMLIPEAVQLVLHAACMARGGDIFVLDMGEQVKLVDLASNLIRLSGLRPGTQVEIKFTGLRPGEKLHEELVGRDEQTEPTSCQQITRICGDPPTKREILLKMLVNLEASVAREDRMMTMAALRALVPTFQPSGTHALDTISLDHVKQQLDGSLETPALEYGVGQPANIS